jgi:hypothetical protein
VQWFIVGGTDTLSNQTYFHHVFAIAVYISGCCSGYGIAGLANLSLTCELSTIFINYRSITKKENLSNFLPMINQVTFFLTYTVFRVFLFPWILYLMLTSIYYSWAYLPLIRKGTSIVTVVLFCALWILCLIWYRLILIGIYKLFLGVVSPQKLSEIQQKKKKEK